MSSTGMQLKELNGRERLPYAVASSDGALTNSAFENARDLAAEDTSLYPNPKDGVATRLFLQQATKTQRKAFYDTVIQQIHECRLSAEHLLCFVKWEPNLKLVQRATRDYLINHNCQVLDEFDGVKLIVDMFEQNALTNPGAVFAGLLSMGDRRINAVIRTLRTRLSMADIREFSRIHPSQLHAASVEFYLDWLLELQQRKETQRFNMVCSAMKLMVLHDESGSVFDYSEQTVVGFHDSNPQFATRFEDYLARISGVLAALGRLNACLNSTDAMTKAWQGHCAIAPALRSVSQHQPCNFFSRELSN